MLHLGKAGLQTGAGRAGSFAEAGFPEGNHHKLLGLPKGPGTQRLGTQGLGTQNSDISCLGTNTNRLPLALDIS